MRNDEIDRQKIKLVNYESGRLCVRDFNINSLSVTFPMLWPLATIYCGRLCVRDYNINSLSVIFPMLCPLATTYCDSLCVRDYNINSLPVSFPMLCPLATIYCDSLCVTEYNVIRFYCTGKSSHLESSKGLMKGYIEWIFISFLTNIVF